MRESFAEYKKTLELNLQNVAILYSGDVLSSIEDTYSEIKTSPLTSPSFITNCITDIYRKSFEKMVKNSKEIILSDVNQSDNIIDRIVSNCGKNLRFVFCSEQLIKQRDLNYRGGSLSYPGLTSKYKGHQFTCYLTEQQFNPEGYIEKQEDKSTFFTWVKYEA